MKQRASTIPALPIWFLILTSLYSLSLFSDDVYSQEPVPVEQDTSEKKIKASDLLRGNTPEARRLAWFRFQVLEEAVSAYFTENGGADLDFKLRSNPNIALFTSPDALSEIVPLGPDPLGEELRRKYADVPPTVALNDIIRNLARSFESKSGKRIDAELLVPTNLEIDVLRQLWTNEAATSSEIYAQLDTSWRISAEEFNEVLEQMWHRGFLDRKKVSPSNAFSLFGIAEIEMSSKNRKNKLYVYWPIVEREKLITFLDAKRYLAYAETQDRAANGRSDSYYALLEKKLIRLLQ